jgi:signal transduction histidine kinase
MPVNQMAVHERQSFISEQNISRNLTLRYILALSAVAFLCIVGEILVLIALNNQMSDSRVVNLAGRQRMLSQKITKTCVLLSNPNTYQGDAERYISDIKEACDIWDETHRGLMNGKFEKEPELKVKNSDTLKHMFLQLDPTFQIIYENAVRISREIDEPTANRNQIIQNSLTEILKNENIFLKGMNKIVYQYDKEAKGRVARLRRIEIGLLITTLFILFLEGMFIFRPAVNHIKRTFRALIESESNAQAVNEELKSVNEQLERTKGELLIAIQEKYQQQINEQKIRSVSLIKGQEKERKRIAKDIHDGLGQMMTALKLTMENIKMQDLPERERLIIEDTKGLIVKTIAETRTISFNLMPTVLNDFGIISGLRMLAEQTSKSIEPNINFICRSDFSRLNKDLEIGIYRIAQEAINNALKYSQATEINIEIQLINSNVILKIQDNGKGFNLKKISSVPEVKKFRMGISNMQERTHLLNGQFGIESTANKGTRILVELPVIYAK